MRRLLVAVPILLAAVAAAASRVGPLPALGPFLEPAHGAWSLALRSVRAYGDGINAYVRQMPASELPLELRLTGTRPSPWTSADMYHQMNRMGWTLAYIATESDRAAAAARVGSRAARALFPD